MTPDTEQKTETLENDEGLGGDEPFCSHGNLLWSEDCDECSEEMFALSDAITKAVGKEVHNGR